MEAIKGVIYGQDKNELGHKYLIGMVLITDEPLDLVLPRGETIIMGGDELNALTTALQGLTKYKIPCKTLGSLESGLLHVATRLKPDDLEKVKTDDKKEKAKRTKKGRLS